MLVGSAVLAAVAIDAAVGGGSAPPVRHHRAATGRTSRSGQVGSAHDRLAVTPAGWHLTDPVSRTVAVVEGHDVVLLGGLATGDVSTGDIWRIDPATGADTLMASLPSPVHDAAGAYLGNRAFVFGGGSTATIASVQAFAPVTASVATAGSLPGARSDLSAVVSGGRAYVLGGYDGSSLMPEVLATSDGMDFQKVGTLARPVRYGAAAAVGGNVYLVGGVLGTGSSALRETNDIQRFDPKTGKTAVIGHLPVDLAHASAVSLGGQLFVVGGRHGTTLSAAIYRIDPSTGKATRAGTLASGRSDAAVAVVGGRAYLFGGETTGPKAPLDTVLVARLVRPGHHGRHQAAAGS